MQSLEPHLAVPRQAVEILGDGVVLVPGRLADLQHGRAHVGHLDERSVGFEPKADLAHVALGELAVLHSHRDRRIDGDRLARQNVEPEHRAFGTDPVRMRVQCVDEQAVANRARIRCGRRHGVGRATVLNLRRESLHEPRRSHRLPRRVLQRAHQLCFGPRVRRPVRRRAPRVVHLQQELQRDAQGESQATEFAADVKDGRLRLTVRAARLGLFEELECLLVRALELRVRPVEHQRLVGGCVTGRSRARAQIGEQLLRRTRNRHVGDDALVGATRGDDVATLASHVDMRQRLALLVADLEVAGQAEVEVATALRLDGECLRFAVLVGERLDGVGVVAVHDEHAAARAGEQAGLAPCAAQLPEPAGQLLPPVLCGTLADERN